MRPLLRLLLLCLFLVGGVPSNAAGAEVEVIPLRHRTVEEMLPLLRPHFPPPVTLSGLGSQLVAQGPPEQLARLRALLETLDTRPRDLLISVDHGGTGRVREQEHGVILHGDERRVQGRVEAGQRSATLHEEATQQIRVMEGGRAVLQVGESRPVSQVRHRVVNGLRVEERTTSQQSAGMALQVEPRLAGDEVILAIHPVNSRFIDHQGSRQVEEAHTVLRGRLGTWMTLGGLEREHTRQQGGWLDSRQQQGAINRTIRVKVELADPR